MRRRRGDRFQGHTITLDDVEGPRAVQVPKLSQGHLCVKTKGSEASSTVVRVRRKIQLEKPRNRRPSVDDALDGEHLGHKLLPVQSRSGGTSFTDVRKEGAYHDDPSF